MVLVAVLDIREVEEQQQAQLELPIAEEMEAVEIVRMQQAEVVVARVELAELGHSVAAVQVEQEAHLQ
jgi:hypothetical protein